MAEQYQNSIISLNKKRSLIKTLIISLAFLTCQKGSKNPSNPELDVHKHQEMTEGHLDKMEQGMDQQSWKKKMQANMQKYIDRRKPIPVNLTVISKGYLSSKTKISFKREAKEYVIIAGFENESHEKTTEHPHPSPQNLRGDDLVLRLSCTTDPMKYRTIEQPVKEVDSFNIGLEEEEGSSPLGGKDFPLKPGEKAVFVLKYRIEPGRNGENFRAIWQRRVQFELSLVRKLPNGEEEVLAKCPVDFRERALDSHLKRKMRTLINTSPLVVAAGFSAALFMVLL